MNQSINENRPPRTKSTLLRELKEEFHELCGLLSVEEIVSNPNLIRAIERLERILVSATA